jgi:hypothetical protein
MLDHFLAELRRHRRLSTLRFRRVQAPSCCIQGGIRGDAAGPPCPRRLRIERPGALLYSAKSYQSANHPEAAEILDVQPRTTSPPLRYRFRSRAAADDRIVGSGCHDTRFHAAAQPASALHESIVRPKAGVENP